MTIQGWQIVLQAIIAVGLVGYGVWLRFVIKQQLQSKDGVIEALKATITTHEAHITNLKNDTAPAIANAYAVMRQHAEQQTADALQYQERLQNVAAARRVREQLEPVEKAMNEIEGLMLGMKILDTHLGKLLYPNRPELSGEGVIRLAQGFLKCVNLMSAEVASRQPVVRAFFGPVPSNSLTPSQ